MSLRKHTTAAPLFFAFLVIGTLFVAPVRGGCLSFGHSCFGAHGKRSDAVYSPSRFDNNDNPDDFVAPPPAWLPLWKNWIERQDQMQKYWRAQQ